jgi:hypothetical protein
MLREVNAMPHCACCGILMPAREVVAEHHGVRLAFCGDRCIRIYDLYKYPRYRAEIEDAERSGRAGRIDGYLGR